MPTLILTSRIHLHFLFGLVLSLSLSLSLRSTSPVPQEEPKLTNFGMANRALTNRCLRTMCGTIEYVAPEILMGSGYDSRADHWSAGILLHWLLVGGTPFHSTDAVLKGRFEMKRLQWGHVSKVARQLVTDLICKDLSKRISANEALESPWINTSPEHLCVVDLEAARRNISTATPHELIRVSIPNNKFQPLVSRKTTKKTGNSRGSGNSRMSAASSAASASSSASQQQHETKPIDELYSLIGGGTFGSAPRFTAVLRKQTGEIHGCKTVDRSTLTAREALAVRSEIHVLQTLRATCSQIVSLVGVFETLDSTHLVYNQVLKDVRDRSLETLVERNGPLSEKDARAFLQDILLAVCYCHEQCIAIRGLDARSIVVVTTNNTGRDGNVQHAMITDMSQSKQMMASSLASPDTFLHTRDCGRSAYQPPETLCVFPSYGLPADMWSTGVVLYFLLTGSFPVERKNRAESEPAIRYRVCSLQALPTPIKPLVNELLDRVPERRISAAEALEQNV